jgi:F-type H+-transporting ATPase subunit delta
MKIPKESRRTARKLFNQCLNEKGLDEEKLRKVFKEIAQAKPRRYLAILSELERLARNELKKKQLTIESPMPLSGAELESIKAKIERDFKKSLDVRSKVSPQLIGGLRIKINSDVWDGSVKARLDQLAERAA